MSDEPTSQPEVPPPGVWDETMGEISGFGGGYEDACRQMVKNGIEWFDKNPDAHPRFQGFRNVMGLCIEDNDDAKALSKAICGDVEPTGAMHQVAVQAVLFIKGKGWPAYVAEMRKREDKPS